MKKILTIFLTTVFSLGANAQETITIHDSNLNANEQIDIPEGMGSQLDSLLSSFNARYYLDDKNCSSTDTNPEFSRETYVHRLSRMPNIMEMPYNDVVREFIDRYMIRQRRSLPYLLSAANFYMPIFEEALETYQVPLELKCLPIIESALNPQATSRVGAGGLWQFMVSTGKQYGLEVNSLVDERRDPIKSSYAAARYLNDLYNIFHDWTLVIAAYNCGPANVTKAIKRAGVEEKPDYWQIYPYLPKETRGYVPAFIAANYLINYYCEHGICPAAFTLPTGSDTIQINRRVHFDQLVAVCNVNLDELRTLNPQYRHNVIPADSTNTMTLRMPTAAISAFIAAGDSVYNHNSGELFNRSEVKVAQAERTTSRSSRSRGKSYKVRRGDTLGAIAARNGTTVAALRRLNGIRGNNIRPGQRLKVN